MNRLRYEELKPYATTETQKRRLDAYLEHGSLRSAASAEGCAYNAFRESIVQIDKKACRQGASQEYDRTGTTGPGYFVERKTIQTGPDGVERVWTKTKAEAGRTAEAIAEIMRELQQDTPQAAPELPLSKPVDADLANCYIVTDYHLGMYAWEPEAGGDWDLDIATELLLGWFKTAIASAPDADSGVLAQLGDFLHFDSLKAITPESGHLLDSDSRRALLRRAAIRLFPEIVQMLLQKHNSVHILMAEGNHDLDSSGWLMDIYAWYYANEPRVTVDETAHPYYCFEWGDTSLFFHHGHKRKMTNVDDVFVAKYREVFGRTKHSYAHMGHLHHDKALETNLMTVEQHRTLASPDAHTSRGGWMSGRSAKVITYHKEYGEVGRLSITPEMVAAA